MREKKCTMISASGMKPLIPYRVVKDSSDGTFVKGDVLWRSENGDINSVTGNGYLPFSEQDETSNDFECVDAPDWRVTKVDNGYSIHEICEKVNDS